MKHLAYSILISLFIFNLSAFAQVLQIGNFSLKTNDGTEIISLKKNGEVIATKQVVGTLSSDGILKDIGGKIIATISNLGLVTDGDKINYGLIDKNGILNNGSGRSKGWNKDGKFQISDKDSLTISPNKKKFYRTASFLILLNFWVNQTSTSPTAVEQIEQNKFKYKDSDVVMAIETGSCQGRCDSLLLLYGNGKLTYRGSVYSSSGATVVGNTTRTKINKLLQKAAEIDFPNLPLPPSLPPFHDGSSTNTMVWVNGKLIKIGCERGESCPKEANEFREFFDKLFAEEIGKLGMD